MTSEEYNWVQSIYFVSPPSISLQNSCLACQLFHNYREQKMNEEWHVIDQLHCIRSTEQSSTKAAHATLVAITNHVNLGYCPCLPCSSKEQRDSLGTPLSPWDVRSRHVSRYSCPVMRLVPQRWDGQAHHVDVRLPEYVWNCGFAASIWNIIHEWIMWNERMAMVSIKSHWKCTYLTSHKGIFIRRSIYHPFLRSHLPYPSRLAQVS